MKNLSSGFVALIIVIVLSAALLALTATTALFSLSEVDLTYNFSKGNETLALAEGCLENTLENIRVNNNYGLTTSPLSLSLAGGSCIINVTGPTATTRQVMITAQLGSYFRYLAAASTLASGQVLLTSFIDGE